MCDVWFGLVLQRMALDCLVAEQAEEIGVLRHALHATEKKLSTTSASDAFNVADVTETISAALSSPSRGLHGSSAAPTAVSERELRAVTLAERLQKMLTSKIEEEGAKPPPTVPPTTADVSTNTAPAAKPTVSSSSTMTSAAAAAAASAATSSAPPVVGEGTDWGHKDVVKEMQALREAYDTSVSRLRAAFAAQIDGAASIQKHSEHSLTQCQSSLQAAVTVLKSQSQGSSGSAELKALLTAVDTSTSKLMLAGDVGARIAKLEAAVASKSAQLAFVMDQVEQGKKEGAMAVKVAMARRSKEDRTADAPPPTAIPESPRRPIVAADGVAAGGGVGRRVPPKTDGGGAGAGAGVVGMSSGSSTKQGRRRKDDWAPLV